MRRGSPPRPATAGRRARRDGGEQRARVVGDPDARRARAARRPEHDDLGRLGREEGEQTRGSEEEDDDEDRAKDHAAHRPEIPGLSGWCEIRLRSRYGKGGFLRNDKQARPRVLCRYDPLPVEVEGDEIWVSLPST